MPEPRDPLSPVELQAELEAMRARVAALADQKGRDVATELVTIRDTLRRLATDNEALRLGGPEQDRPH
jgi:hypothetical protein